MKRDQAFGILKKYNKNNNLIKHGIAVEAVMKHLANLYGEDAEYWGNVGLLHDVDYELYPDEHCKKCAEILKNENVQDDIIRAIQSHGYGICVDIKPERTMEKILYTIDELTGLITATALMKPDRKIGDVSLESIKKKWKKKEFAKGVNREIIQNGADMLELELDYIIEQTLIAMKSVAYELGL